MIIVLMIKVLLIKVTPTKVLITNCDGAVSGHAVSPKPAAISL